MVTFRRWQTRRWDNQAKCFIHTDKSGYFLLGFIPIWITKEEGSK